MKNVIKYLFIIFILQSEIVSAQMQLDWVRIFSGNFDNNLAFAIDLDDSGNVFVTGTLQISSNSFECLTIKYNRFGDTLWNRHYQRSTNSGGRDIKVDDFGSVYVSSGFLIKYDKNGFLLWERYDSTLYYEITLDSFGYIYGGGTNRQSKLTAGKYDSNGNKIWNTSYSFPGSAGYDLFGGIALDKFGNVIITGRSKSTSTYYDYATVKFSSEGRLIWSRRYNGPSPYKDDGAYGITTDLSDNIYVTGFSMDSLNNDNCFTIKYDSSGNVLWTKRIQSSEHIANIGYNLESDSSQNLFIAGRLGGGTATIKLDINGNLIWSRHYPQGSVITDNYPKIILDTAYNVHVTGNSTASGYSDYAAIKYDSSGNQIYVVTYNYNPIGFEYAFDMALDKKGNLYLAGDMSTNYGTVKFSPIMTGVVHSNILPSKFVLLQNYPNPFNPSTIINYKCSMFNYISLKVYDILGNEVATLINENKPAGSYDVQFNGSDYPSGIYFYSLIIDGNVADTKRMVLLK